MCNVTINELMKRIEPFLYGWLAVVVENLRICIPPGKWSSQGYVLKPIQFVFFINDISTITVTGVIDKQYVNELKLYTSLVSTDDSKNPHSALSNL